MEERGEGAGIYCIKLQQYNLHSIGYFFFLFSFFSLERPILYRTILYRIENLRYSKVLYCIKIRQYFCVSYCCTSLVRSHLGDSVHRMTTHGDSVPLKASLRVGEPVRGPEKPSPWP